MLKFRLRNIDSQRMPFTGINCTFPVLFLLIALSKGVRIDQITKPTTSAILVNWPSLVRYLLCSHAYDDMGRLENRRCGLPFGQTQVRCAI